MCVFVYIRDEKLCGACVIVSVCVFIVVDDVGGNVCMYVLGIGEAVRVENYKEGCVCVYVRDKV